MISKDQEKYKAEKTIILMKSPERIAGNMEIKYKILKNVFMEIISGELNEKQRERILDILNLAHRVIVLETLF